MNAERQRMLKMKSRGYNSVGAINRLSNQMNEVVSRLGLSQFDSIAQTREKMTSVPVPLSETESNTIQYISDLNVNSNLTTVNAVVKNDMKDGVDICYIPSKINNEIEVSSDLMTTSELIQTSPSQDFTTTTDLVDGIDICKLPDKKNK